MTEKKSVHGSLQQRTTQCLNMPPPPTIHPTIQQSQATVPPILHSAFPSSASPTTLTQPKRCENESTEVDLDGKTTLDLLEPATSL